MDIESFFSSPDHAIAETVHGPMVCFRHDTGVSEKLLTYGEYAAGELFAYRSLLSPGDVVVDVGANIGAISAALQRDGKGYSIWAFEPQPAYHAVAAANLLGGQGVRVLPLAVGAETGTIDVPELDIRRTGNYGAFAKDYEAMRITSIDDCLKQLEPIPASTNGFPEAR